MTIIHMEAIPTVTDLDTGTIVVMADTGATTVIESTIAIEATVIEATVIEAMEATDEVINVNESSLAGGLVTVQGDSRNIRASESFAADYVPASSATMRVTIVDIVVH